MTTTDRSRSIGHVNERAHQDTSFATSDTLTTLVVRSFGMIRKKDH